MSKEEMIISRPDPEDFARENGKPAHISLRLWNMKGQVGVREVPEGMDNDQFAEYLNQKYKELHHKSKIKLVGPEDY